MNKFSKQPSVTISQAIKMVEGNYLPNLIQLGRIKKQVFNQKNNNLNKISGANFNFYPWIWSTVIILVLIFFFKVANQSNSSLLTFNKIKSNYFGFLLNKKSKPNNKISIAYAAGMVKKEAEKIKSPNIIIHTITTQILFTKNGNKETITYDLWQDNGSGRFKNKTINSTSTSIQVNDGFNRWDYDQNQKILMVEHYLNVPKGGIANRGKQVWLLVDFEKILKNKSRLKIDRVKFENKPALVLTWTDKDVSGPEGKKITQKYNYYFNSQFQMVGQEIWQVEAGKRLLKQRITINKIELLPRTKDNLKRIFKFDYQVPTETKIEEKYLDANTLTPITLNPSPIASSSPTIKPNVTASFSASQKERIVNLNIDNKCRLVVSTQPANNRNVINLNYPDCRSQTKDKILKLTAVSKNQDILAYLSYGGEEYPQYQIIKLYLPNQEYQHLNLTYLDDTSYVNNLAFSNDGRLIIIIVKYINVPVPNQYKIYADAYDINKLMANYPTNIDPQTKNLKNEDQYKNQKLIAERSNPDIVSEQENCQFLVKDARTKQVIYSIPWCQK